tara:strand:+ start:2090 stop:3265 length:1176 start_codon:yes stop_codon:yes gene_type:complete
MTNKDTYLPYGRHTVTEADKLAVLRVLQSSHLTQGPAVPAFEESVASHVNANHGVAVNSATSALHLACLALGLQRGDYLWTSPITFVASANCALYCGANVDFVDIDPVTGLMSVDALSSKLHNAELSGTLPKIVVPVHLCGTSCDMERIFYLSKRYGFHILEDASHAIGGFYQNQPVGNCRFSDICVFSFHPVKIITTAEGGLVTTNNPDFAQRIVDLRSHGIIKDQARFQNSPQGPWTYEQQLLGYNYRMSDIQAALGLSQLDRISQIISERAHLFRQYQSLLADLPITLLHVPENVASSHHLAVIRLSDTSSALHLHVFEELQAAQIGVQLHYTPVHLQPYYRNLGFTEGDFPEAEAYASNALSLPLFPGLKNDDITRVVTKLQALLSI